MLRFIKAIGWGFGRFGKFFGNIPSFFIKTVMPINKGTIVCWSYSFKQYSCNPRYITEYLLKRHPEYRIFWVFRGSNAPSDLDRRIKVVKYRSLEYLKVMSTAEFLITNARTDSWKIYWQKRHGQKYIMTWHGGVALKKVEADAESKLSYNYVKKAKMDSKICDLMLSGAKCQTRLLSEKFWYDGEILEKGTPRCDVLFDHDMHKTMSENVRSAYGIPADSRIVLYAPTFRTNKSIEPYRMDWEATVKVLKDMYKGADVRILLRLHPNLIGKVDISTLLYSPSVIDVTSYHDMQELMCISDMLITDYSSSMFDFMMLRRPCLLYATDMKEYDRGYYYNFTELPFPLAQTQDELIENIRTFDEEKYITDIERFDNEKVGLIEDGNACKALAEWMQSHSL